MENIKLIEKLDLVRLNIQLTKKCNQRCRSCNSYLMKTDYEMSTSDVTKAIKEISNHFAIKNIAFTGGEPTLRKDILQIAETAKKLGIPAQNIFITHNGRILELSEDEAKFTTSVPSGKVLVDGLGVGDVGNIVLRDRQHLSQDGLIVIVLTMDSSTGEIVSGPDVISRGFVYVRESENLMEDVKNVIKEEVAECEKRHITDWSTIKSTLKDNLRDYIFQKTKRDPMILPIIMEV